jgi:hypothetical protein
MRSPVLDPVVYGILLVVLGAVEPLPAAACQNKQQQGISKWSNRLLGQAST